ncbi:hypothetical protein FXV83_16235 [Bradyrhizobium hipponense]|uniref:Uncharacterized protein n=1 Tax=Bradyrhizobium hipponense TaxID=2605638 RepID=A0A5S4YNA3_9BRAD|nr:hypothetical protein [Bradyrhizobium hipponense]TYO65483.1 hypothetical protein FXV83_16235 [Bradyrhizobium hipponense]
MFTITEARQRLALSGMRLTRRDREFRVAFAELPYSKAEPSAYYTDDLEDAVLTGARMRATPPLDAALQIRAR